MRRQKLYISSVHNVSSGRVNTARRGAPGCGYTLLIMGVALYFLGIERVLLLLLHLIEMLGR